MTTATVPAHVDHAAGAPTTATPPRRHGVARAGDRRRRGGRRVVVWLLGDLVVGIVAGWSSAVDRRDLLQRDAGGARCPGSSG